MPSTLMLIEDDASTRSLLAMVLQDEGFQVVDVIDLDAAWSLLATHTFTVILSDLFGDPAHPVAHDINNFIASAAPTPVGIMTARRLPASFAVPAAAFLLHKPFEIQECFVALAAATHQSLDPRTDPQAAIIHQFLAGMATQDWEGILVLCADEIVYHPVRAQEHPTLQGKKACQTYFEQISRDRSEIHFTDIHIYPLPFGRIVRFTHHVRLLDGSEQTFALAASFHFQGELIGEVGFRLPSSRTSGER